MAPAIFGPRCFATLGKSDARASIFFGGVHPGTWTAGTSSMNGNGGNPRYCLVYLRWCTWHRLEHYLVEIRVTTRTITIITAVLYLRYLLTCNCFGKTGREASNLRISKVSMYHYTTVTKTHVLKMSNTENNTKNNFYNYIHLKVDKSSAS